MTRLSTVRSVPLALLLIAAAVHTPQASAQALTLNTSFGNNGSTVLQLPAGWWTDWSERNAHIINQGGAFQNSWVVAGSSKTLLSGNLFYRRDWGYFSDSLTSSTISGFASEAGPPLSTGGIVSNGSEVTFIGTGAPSTMVDSVFVRRTSADPFAIPSSCAGGFQTHLSFGPNARDEVRGAASRANGGFFAVGATRLANGETRGLIAAVNFNCAADSSFGSGGAVTLDVNPFVIGAPPRRVRINAAASYTNGAGQPRLVVAGGVRYGLTDPVAGACFMAVYTATGALDTSFDGDGIRLFDAAPPFGSGATFCDFNNVIALNDASGRGFATIADWRRVDLGESDAHLLRFTETGAPLAGFNGGNVSSVNEYGPSALGVRGDGRLIRAENLLVTSQGGGTLVATQSFRLIDPASAAPLGFLQIMPSAQASRQISRIVAGANNRVYVIGTAGPGRFGHNQIVVARFADGTRTLSVSAIGGGTVASTPAGIAGCGGPGGTCSASFLPGTSVTLTATPLPFNRFFGWGGAFAACGANPACALTVTTDVAGDAQFVPTSTVAIARVGQGFIASNPAGLGCGITPGSGCSGSFDRDLGFNSPVRFTAIAASGWSFVSWTGDFASCGSNPVCDIVMTQPSFTATANFAALADPIFANGFEP